MRRALFASTSMADYSSFLCILHTLAFVLWASTSQTELLFLKLAYITFLMAFYLVV